VLQSIVILLLVYNPALTAQSRLFYEGSILSFYGEVISHDAMLIEKDRIVAIGSFKDLRNSYPHAILTSLNGKTVLPGIIDSHAHVAELGAASLFADVSKSQTVEDMIQVLKAFYPNPKSGQWLIGQGWDEGVWASLGYPNRKLLDQAFPQNPVKLASLHGFASFYNGLALAISGISAQTSDPEGGTILRNPDGSPTGVMLTLAKRMVDKHVPALTREQERDAIVKGLNILAAEGVTSVHEAGINRVRLPVWEDLAKYGQLPIRVYGLLDGNDSQLVSDWTKRGPYQSEDQFFTVKGFKIFYDGSLGSRTALLSEPYSDDPKAARMTERISLPQIRQLGEQLSPKGFQLAVHTIGDAANRNIIELYRDLKKKFPGADLRWRLEHAQVLDPQLIQEIGELGLIASVQSSHAVGDSKWAEERLGPERIKYAYAWRSLLNSGVRVMLNSDLPGEPWAPRETLYFATMRKTLDGKADQAWYPEQSFTVVEALRSMTVEGAYGEFAEARLGQLKVGYQADFIIIDRNPLNIPREQLKDLKVLETWVGGKQVFATGNAS